MFPKMPSRELQELTNYLLGTPDHQDSRIEFDSSDYYGQGIYVIRDPYFVYYLGKKPGIAYHPLTIRTHVRNGDFWEESAVRSALRECMKLAVELSKSEEPFPLHLIGSLGDETLKILRMWKFGIGVHPTVGFHGHLPLLKCGDIFYDDSFVEKVNHDDHTYTVSGPDTFRQHLPYSHSHRDRIPLGSLIITSNYFTDHCSVYRVTGLRQTHEGLWYTLDRDSFKEVGDSSRGVPKTAIHSGDIAGVLRWGP